MFWYIVGIAAAIITLSGFLPQIFKSFKTKKMDDISYGMYFLLLFGMFLWLLYGIHIKDLIVIGANIAGVCFNIILIGMKWNYSKK
jgi:MtN3 and saliva related transmembrane protein|tara:strand:+ start:782 stop:1039 length:258 start_codon:yes stop_codon:yes gene_type:complete